VRQEGQTVRKTEAEIMDNLIEELADVSIMTDQIKYLLGISEKQIHDIRSEKIMRTAAQINEKGAST
jgi:predicted house-cleaning noncanonical NTP pyrophosphatase (MazG superfamily)